MHSTRTRSRAPMVLVLVCGLVGGSRSLAAGQAPAAPPAPQAAAQVQAEENKSAITFYGFARLDAVLDDSRINSFQTPTFVRSEPRDAENRSNFTMHPRLTRFGFTYRAPATPEGPSVTAKIEVDFHNGGSQSRAVPRYRHVFLQMNWGAHALLAGQTSDIISPLFPTVNADTLMWNAGNLGDRRAQFRYSYEPSKGFTLRAGIGLTGAIDAQDLDENGVVDGEASTLPNFQARIGFNAPNGNVLLGVWGHYAQLRTDTAIGGETEFAGRSYGGDFELRLTPQVNLRGEIWGGANLGDFRGGVGQSFNPTTGRDIDSHGGWVELGLRKGRYSFSTGYTVDDPEDVNVPTGGPTRNGASYITNQYRIVPTVTAGIDYTYWQTELKELPNGTDNRVNFYLMYGF